MTAFGPLVDAAWLEHNQADVHVIDVRWYLDGRSGQDAYAAGHIPGAVRLDLDADLSRPASPADGRHPLPTPERFAAALGRIGVAAGDRVVCYDDAGGSVAARLWWLLHVLDEPVAVLDGGLAAWPGALSAEPVAALPVERAPRPWPVGRFVSAEQVAAAEHAVVFDARTSDRYRAGQDGVDPRPGHIPGALSAWWGDNLGPDGRFLPAASLRARFAAAADRPAIAYCGSGVTACHDLLAMQVAGLDGAAGSTALYPGSWSQWGADPARPTEV
ncbi:sulfurtransferase [uncultured Jatrophihabitans sp.]|uniref:sulfurtransferase n=1 Tax=uncultured Jatrophihabitans sp. TaxID=1610747 RepID=UPI0035CA2BE8